MKKQVENRLQGLERDQGDDQVKIVVDWSSDPEHEYKKGDVVVWMDQDGEVHKKVIR